MDPSPSPSPPPFPSSPHPLSDASARAQAGAPFGDQSPTSSSESAAQGHRFQLLAEQCPRDGGCLQACPVRALRALPINARVLAMRGWENAETWCRQQCSETTEEMPVAPAIEQSRALHDRLLVQADSFIATMRQHVELLERTLASLETSAAAARRRRADADSPGIRHLQRYHHDAVALLERADVVHERLAQSLEDRSRSRRLFAQLVHITAAFRKSSRAA